MDILLICQDCKSAVVGCEREIPNGVAQKLCKMCSVKNCTLPKDIIYRKLYSLRCKGCQILEDTYGED